MAETLVIRADANSEIGIGHVTRCLSLAEAWQDRGGRVIFAMAQPLSSLQHRLRSEGFCVEVLGCVAGDSDSVRTGELCTRAAATWAVIDGNRFGRDYQHVLKQAGCRVLILDDYGTTGEYSADIVLNEDLAITPELYMRRQPYTQLLLGPSYALLRKQFREQRPQSRVFSRVATRVLVTMGGSDPENVTLAVIHALRQLGGTHIDVRVIVGCGNTHLQELRRAAGKLSSRKLEIIRDVANMAEHMAWAEVAVVACGVTLWEVIYMGASVICWPRNQANEETLAILQEKKIVEALPRNADASCIADYLGSLLKSKTRREAMSRRGQDLIDGLGTARVAQLMIKIADSQKN